MEIIKLQKKFMEIIIFKTNHNYGFKLYEIIDKLKVM